MPSYKSQKNDPTQRINPSTMSLILYFTRLSFFFYASHKTCEMRVGNIKLMQEYGNKNYLVIPVNLFPQWSDIQCMPSLVGGGKGEIRCYPNFLKTLITS